MGETVAIGSSIDELLAGAGAATPIESAGKSGARLDRLVIDGDPYVVKYLDPDGDWTLRAAGVEGGAVLELWRRGILARLPECIEVPIVGVARDGVAALLMRDVGEWLVPVTDDPVPLEQHLRFVDHMAALHAQFWDTELDIDVVSPTTRYLELSPQTAAREAALGSEHVVPALIAEGWPLFAQVAPKRRGGDHPAGARPGTAGRCHGHYAEHAGARQLEARQPGHHARRAAPSFSTGRRPAAGRG